MLISVFTSAVGQVSVPQGAIDVAEEYLNTEWRFRASRNPGFYSVHVTDVRGARLGEPYIECRLDSADTKPLSAGLPRDPRSHTEAYSYTFPVFADERLITAMAVIRNPVEHGSKKYPDKGDFMLGWIIHGEAGIPSQVVGIQHRGDRSASDAVVVVLPGFGARPEDKWRWCIVYTDTTGAYLRECDFYAR